MPNILTLLNEPMHSGFTCCVATCAAASSTNTLSRSTNSLGKSPGQSFLSSVISLRPFAGTNASATKIMPKRLWRTRSKSRSYLGTPPWVAQGSGRWQHATNRMVVLESSHLLMLHEFERIGKGDISVHFSKTNNVCFCYFSFAKSIVTKIEFLWSRCNYSHSKRWACSCLFSQCTVTIFFKYCLETFEHTLFPHTRSSLE